LLLQLQLDRLYLNWRKQADGAYPRFSKLFPVLTDLVQRWREFVDSTALANIRLKHFEMTYINHIYEGGLWPTFSQAKNVFRPFAFTSVNVGLPEPATMIWQEAYRLEKCNVLINANAGTRADTKQKVLQLDLRGNSQNAEQSFDGLEAWFSSANVDLGRVFLSLTTDAAQKECRRVDA
jgi:uncharacterized protein (TIGR04255 family)